MAYKSPLQEIPGNLIRTVLGVLKFKGRSTRTEFWTYSLLGSWVASFVGAGLERLTGEAHLIGPSVSETVVLLVYFLPIPALFARRLHDIGWSGWFALAIPFAYIFGAFSENATPRIAGIEKVDFGPLGLALMLSLILGSLAIALIPPAIGPNRYGADPRLGKPSDDMLPTDS